MFDCVMPSRAARHGTAYTRSGVLNLRNERFRKDFSPLDEETDCYVSKEFTKSYVRHLFMSKESLGGVLLTLHNLRFYVQLMEEARAQIGQGTFDRWAQSWIQQYGSLSSVRYCGPKKSRAGGSAFFLKRRRALLRAFGGFQVSVLGACVFGGSALPFAHVSFDFA